MLGHKISPGHLLIEKVLKLQAPRGSLYCRFSSYNRPTIGRIVRGDLTEAQIVAIAQ